MNKTLREEPPQWYLEDPPKYGRPHFYYSHGVPEAEGNEDWQHRGAAGLDANGTWYWGAFLHHKSKGQEKHESGWAASELEAKARVEDWVEKWKRQEERESWLSTLSISMKEIEQVRDFAFDSHKSVNQTYDGKPYGESHLMDVYRVALQFLHLIPEEAWERVLKAALCHDTLEDVHFLSYNDLAKKVGFDVADIVYALTNEKGKTRKERASQKYYDEMKLVPFAVFVKLCDRIANMRHSKESGSSMFEKYKKELPEFKAALYSPELQEMWDYLESL